MTTILSQGENNSYLGTCVENKFSSAGKLIFKPMVIKYSSKEQPHVYFFRITLCQKVFLTVPNGSGGNFLHAGNLWKRQETISDPV